MAELPDGFPMGSAPTLTYQCGCEAAQVGQTFAHVDVPRPDGEVVPRQLMVCPLHHEPLAPFERAPQPWRGKLTLEVELVANDHRHAEQWAAALVATVNADSIVRATNDYLAVHAPEGVTL